MWKPSTHGSTCPLPKITLQWELGDFKGYLMSAKTKKKKKIVLWMSSIRCLQILFLSPGKDSLIFSVTSLIFFGPLEEDLWIRDLAPPFLCLKSLIICSIPRGGSLLSGSVAFTPFHNLPCFLSHHHFESTFPLPATSKCENIYV